MISSLASNLFFVKRGIGFGLFFTALGSALPGRFPIFLLVINNENLIVFFGVELTPY